MKRIIALICGLILILSMTACKSKRENSDNLLGVNAGEDNEVAVKVNIPQFDIPDSLPELSVEKIGSFKWGRLGGLETSSNGIYYKGEDDLWGIITLDGKHDTGAIYYDCKVEGDFFSVATEMPSGAAEGASAYNCYTLVDAEGNVLVPGKYFCCRLAYDAGGNDRYYELVEVMDVTTDDDEGIISCLSNSAAYDHFPAGTMFKGKTYLYDAVTGKVVEGVESSRSFGFYIDGNVIFYTDNDGEYRKVDENGIEVEDEEYFDNGTYLKSRAIYNCYGEKLFDVPKDVDPFYYTDGYYAVSKLEGEKLMYALMNDKGELVSASFENIPSVYGTIIKCSGKIYSFDGNQLMERDIEKVYQNDFAPDFYYLYSPDNNGTCTLITADGKVYYEDTDLKGTTGIPNHFVAGKSTDGEYCHYSHKDGAYTIQNGDAFTCWTVAVDNSVNVFNRDWDIVDTISGNVLISSHIGYSTALAKDSTCYIYAYTGDAYDVYILKAE